MHVSCVFLFNHHYSLSFNVSEFISFNFVVVVVVGYVCYVVENYVCVSVSVDVILFVLFCFSNENQIIHIEYEH